MNVHVCFYNSVTQIALADESIWLFLLLFYRDR